MCMCACVCERVGVCMCVVAEIVLMVRSGVCQRHLSPQLVHCLKMALQSDAVFPAVMVTNLPECLGKGGEQRS